MARPTWTPHTVWGVFFLTTLWCDKMTMAAKHSDHGMVQLPAKDLKRSVINTIFWAAFMGLLVLSWEGADMRPMELIHNSENMIEFAAGFFPPDFLEWKLYVSEMWITIQIAIWGTVLSIVCSIPLGILCSENIVPAWVYQPVRRIMDSFRAINEMVFAMLFVVAVGLGPFAGVLALWIHTTGILAKLYSEAVEAIDPQPVEGIRATGANGLQEVIFGVIPQVLPLWISYSLYRFESNVRSATVLGIVGAGGIGMVLWEYIRGFYYAETAAVMIIVIVSVSLLDILSQRLRKLVT
jgi:phosphonate transport system permease protein